MKPIIKWVGGKARFLKIINEKINEFNFENYYEPFFGSGAVFFSLFPNDVKRDYYISDANVDLMDFYNWVKKEKPEIIYSALSDYLKSFQNMSEEEKRNQYSLMKDHYNKLAKKCSTKKEKEEKSKLFFIINKTSFNGIYRVNSNGYYNVPVGRYKTYCYPKLDQLKSMKEILKNTKIKSGDWWEILDTVSENDLIYLDPPYYPDFTSKFIGYTDPRFGEEEHIKLINKVKEYVVNKKANVIISNSNSQVFKELLFEKFKKYNEIINVEYIEIQTKRSLNPRAEEKERFKEALYIIRRNKNG